MFVAKHTTKKQLQDAFVEALNALDVMTSKYEDLLKEYEELRRRIAFYENSNSPPSKGSLKSKSVKKNRRINRTKSDRKAGGQEGHKGVSRPRKNNPKVYHNFKNNKPPKCKCGKDMRICKTNIRDIIGIKIEMEENRHITQVAVCDSCGNEQHAPNDLPAKGGFDKMAVALMTKLRVSGLKYEKIADVINDATGGHISRSAVINTVGMVSDAMEGPTNRIAGNIKKSKSVGIDETSAHVEEPSTENVSNPDGGTICTHIEEPSTENVSNPDGGTICTHIEEPSTENVSNPDGGTICTHIEEPSTENVSNPDGGTICTHIEEPSTENVSNPDGGTICTHIEEPSTENVSNPDGGTICTHIEEPSTSTSWWMWVMQSGVNVYITIEPSRGHSVLDEHLNGYNGVVTSDKYPAYHRYGIHDRHQLCWAHELRALAFMADDKQVPLHAKILYERTRELYHSACAVRNERCAEERRRLYPRNKKTSVKDREKMRAEHKRIRAELRRSYESALHNILFEYRNMTYPEAVKCLNRLRTSLPHLFLFMEHYSVESTNNASERALRPYVSYRNTSKQIKGGKKWARRISRLFTCDQTWKRQGKSFIAEVKKII